MDEKKSGIKSRLYIEMRFCAGFPAQVFRNWVYDRPIPRDLYMELSFCRYSPVQARLVQWAGEPLPPTGPKQNRPAAMRGVWSGKRDSNYVL